jgi:DNA-binding CsgD family transcriptional regulator
MITDLYAPLLNVSSKAMLLQEVVSFATELGFSNACAFMTLRKAATTQYSVMDVNNYQDSWKTICHDEAMIATDPVISHSSKSNLPLIWNQALYVKCGAGALWEIFKANDFDSGIAISMRDHLGNGYKIGLARDQPLTSDPRELSRLVADAQLFGTFAQSAMNRIWNPLPETDFVKLTSRELACLSWTMEGKTAWEIGDLLNITERTANFHLGNASHKLATESKLAAVVKAIRIGLIG